MNSPKFDKKKTKSHGKIFTLDRDTNKSGRVDIEDLDWNYLNGDGDFRSKEVKKLRDEADIIITNPPFSLFREFVNWIFEDNKKFIITTNDESASLLIQTGFHLVSQNGKQWTFLNDNKMLFNNLSDVVYSDKLFI